MGVCKVGKEKIVHEEFNATDAFCNIYIEGAYYLQFTLMKQIKKTHKWKVFHETKYGNVCTQ